MNRVLGTAKRILFIEVSPFQGGLNNTIHVHVRVCIYMIVHVHVCIYMYMCMYMYIYMYLCIVNHMYMYMSM